MARANQNKWDAINQGINNGFNTYRDISRENKQQARQQSQDQIASEERSRSHMREDTKDAQEAQRFGLDTEEQGNRNALTKLQVGNATAENEYQNKVVGTNPDGTPLTRREQIGNLDVQGKQTGIQATQSSIQTQGLQRQSLAYEMNKAKEGDSVAHAKTALWQAVASGNQDQVAQVKQGLLNQGYSDYAANQALQETQAQVLAGQNAKQAQLWISPEFEPVKETLRDFDKRAQGIKLLSDLKSKYDASSGKVYGEGPEGQDAMAQVAQIRREYFGDTKSGEELQNRWTKGTASQDMQHYIDMQKGMLNNQYAAKKPELVKYSGREPYVANMMQSIDSGLKYQPTLLQNADVPQTRSIFSITPAATGTQANQQFLQQAASGGAPQQQGPNAAQPQMNGQPIQVGMPNAGNPQQLPPQEHPLYKLRAK